jgi:hypothetical protein
MAGSADMEKMSRDRRKPSPRDLGTMKAVTPPDMSENEAAARDAEARAKAARTADTMTPAPGVAEKAMEAARQAKEREQMGDAYDKAARKYASGGSVGSASSRADGCAQRGKTKGRIV